MDGRPEFWFLNAPGKMITYSRDEILRYLTLCTSILKWELNLHGLYFLRHLKYISFEVPWCRPFR